MLGVSLYLIAELYETFFSNPVIGKINKYIVEEQEFPAVTFCNLEPFISEKASDYFESNLSSNFTGDQLDEIRKNLKHSLFGNYFNLTEKQSFGLSLSETLSEEFLSLYLKGLKIVSP